MSATPKQPKTVNRLQRLVTDWQGESGLPVRRLNLRVAAMMLAGALGRATDDQDDPVFLARGGVAIELRGGERARATRDVDLLIRTAPDSLLDRLDEALAEPYQAFSFQRGEPERLPLRPQVRRLNVKVAFSDKPFMTLAVEIAPTEASEEIERLPPHDLANVGLAGPDSIPVLAAHWQIAQKLHGVTELPPRAGRTNPRYWDLIDLQLLRALLGAPDERTKHACTSTFAVRAKQAWPPTVTVYPGWRESYTAMARNLDIAVAGLDQAVTAVHELITEIDTVDRHAPRTTRTAKLGPQLGPETRKSDPI